MWLFVPAYILTTTLRQTILEQRCRSREDSMMLRFIFCMKWLSTQLKVQTSHFLYWLYSLTICGLKSCLTALASSSAYSAYRPVICKINGQIKAIIQWHPKDSRWKQRAALLFIAFTDFLTCLKLLNISDLMFVFCTTFAEYYVQCAIWAAWGVQIYY